MNSFVGVDGGRVPHFDSQAVIAGLRSEIAVAIYNEEDIFGASLFL